MDDNKRNDNPDYGVRLSGDELAQHQQKYQQPTSASGGEYGPQGQQQSSEYGPQDGFHAPQPPSGYQQPGAGQPGFGPSHGQPYAHPAPHFGGPQLSPEMTKEPKRPKVVGVAFWAIVAAGISYLVSQLILVTLPNRGLSDAEIGMLEDMMGSMGDQLPFESVDAYLNSSMMTAVMVGQAVILAVAYVLVALGIRNGWRSMRILGTIFAVFSLFNLSLAASPLVTVFSVLAVVLGIVGIVYAWLPASTEYYRHKAWQKAAKKVYPDVPSR